MKKIAYLILISMVVGSSALSFGSTYKVEPAMNTYKSNIHYVENSAEIEHIKSESISRSMTEYQQKQLKEQEKMYNNKEELELSIENSLMPPVSEESPQVENSMVDEEFEQELPYDQLEEVAICVTAEAQNQGYKGMYLVVCVIFNRVKHPDYPDTIHGVISQPYQFTSYSDGGMQKWNQPTDECYQAVLDAYNNNRYPELIYFREGGYSEYGTPAFQYGDHYFSTK